MSSFPPAEHEITAPDLPPGEWLEHQPPRLSDLRGHLILLYFWSFTSLPSLLILAQLRSIEDHYRDYGLVVISIHTPQHSFECEREQVILAAREHHIRHPILLDNNYLAARSFRVTSLPCVVLIDHQGIVRHTTNHITAALEQSLIASLRAAQPAISLPGQRLPLSTQPLEQVTTTLYAGSRRSALGNPEGYATHAPLLYRLPVERVPGYYYAEGVWRTSDESFVFEGQAEGMLRVLYRAVECYAVFSPHPTLIDRLLKPAAVAVEVWQDDLPLGDEQRGDDVTLDGRVIIERPGLYHLVRNPQRGPHELSIRVRTHGLSVFAFYLWRSAERGFG
jgi:hypothetical protein